MGRESNALIGIEQERAKRRQAENAKETMAKKTNNEKRANKKPVTDTKKGQSRDAVGEKGGVSGLTAERSAFCVQTMAALTKIGKTVEAHQIRQ